MNITILTLSVVALLLIAVIILIRSQTHIISDVLTKFIAPKQTYDTDRSQDILDWEYYGKYVETIRMYGCTSMINYKVTATDNVVCVGSVTRRGIMDVLEDFGFIGNGLSSALSDNLITTFSERTLITILPSGDYLQLNYQIESNEHYFITLRYLLSEDDNTAKSYIGNTALEYWIPHEEDDTGSLADVFLKGIDDFCFADKLPTKYNDNLSTLISLTNSITGERDGRKFKLTSLDINSTKSSTPTLYCSFTLDNPPSSFDFRGLNDLNVSEEFARWMVSQGEPVSKYSIQHNGGYIHILDGEYTYDVRLLIHPPTPTEGDIRLDITIVKRRNKSIAA